MIKGLSGCCGRAVFVAAAGWLLLLVAACGGGGERWASSADGGRADAVASEDEGLETVEVPTRWATGNAADLRTLIATNPNAFVGRVMRLRETRLENPLGLAGSSGRAQLPVSVFEVRVEASLAGVAGQGTTVIVEQAGGVSVNADGSRTRFLLEGDDPLAIGQKYLLFATTTSSGSYTTAPFGRFRVAADGSLEVAPEWARLGAVQELAGLHVEEAKREIAEAR